MSKEPKNTDNSGTKSASRGGRKPSGPVHRRRFILQNQVASTRQQGAQPSSKPGRIAVVLEGERQLEHDEIVELGEKRWGELEGVPSTPSQSRPHSARTMLMRIALAVVAERQRSHPREFARLVALIWRDSNGTLSVGALDTFINGTRQDGGDTGEMRFALGVRREYSTLSKQAERSKTPLNLDPASVDRFWREPYEEAISSMPPPCICPHLHCTTRTRHTVDGWPCRRMVAVGVDFSSTCLAGEHRLASDECECPHRHCHVCLEALPLDERALMTPDAEFDFLLAGVTEYYGWICADCRMTRAPK